MSRQIVVYGTNESKHAYYGLNSRGSYECANSSITRGLTYEPLTLKDCFDRFPSVRAIAQNIGFITGICGATGQGSPNGSSTPTGGFTYQYDLWTGTTYMRSATLPAENLIPIHTYLAEPSSECHYIHQKLGTAWLGCLWGTPALSFSCTCPNIGSKFYAFLKLRLNVATFWNTPKDAPIKRADFLDAIKYGRKIDITVAGDLKVKLGQVVDILVDALSGYPYGDSKSELNGLYYITGIKHVMTNSGGYEMALSLTQIPKSVNAGACASQEIKFKDQYP